MLEFYTYAALKLVVARGCDPAALPELLPPEEVGLVGVLRAGAHGGPASV